MRKWLLVSMFVRLLCEFVFACIFRQMSIRVYIVAYSCMHVMHGCAYQLFLKTCIHHSRSRVHQIRINRTGKQHNT
jgi:hypothetical protein